MKFWTWFTTTDAGLITRIAIGVIIFSTFAIIDYLRHRDRATRWREYTILLIAVAGAIVYGVLNDQLTSSISWEYFYYGKDLAEKLGPHTPPDPLALHLAAAVVGIKATWSAGLIIGVAILLANNPSKSLPQLPMGKLLRIIPIIFVITAIVAAIGAGIGYSGLPARWNEDFAEMLQGNLWRPRRFMTVYGIHLGGYLGGAIATIIAVIRIRRIRRASDDRR
jgi:hypothetical protein